MRVEKRGEEKEPPQIIQNDKTNILLRFLKLQREHGESLSAGASSSSKVTVPGAASHFLQESGALAAQASASGSSVRKRYSAALGGASEQHAEAGNETQPSASAADGAGPSAGAATEPKRPRVERSDNQDDDADPDAECS